MLTQAGLTPRERRFELAQDVTEVAICRFSATDPAHYHRVSMIADVTVRLARLADAAEIAAMSRDYIERGLPWTWTEDRVARAIVDLETNVAVVGNSGAVTAFGIMFHTAEDAHLLLFAVRRTHQRKGVGSALLGWLEAVARNAGAKKIRVECLSKNRPARLFYSEHGYHELTITQRMYRGVADGIHLEKWLRVESTEGPAAGPTEF